MMPDLLKLECQSCGCSLGAPMVFLPTEPNCGTTVTEHGFANVRQDTETGDAIIRRLCGKCDAMNHLKRCEANIKANASGRN